MVIRQEFNQDPQLPPRPFLEQIMDGLSKAYCFLWDRKDKRNKLKFTWEELNKYYNKNAFRSSLRKLNNHGLLDYKESKDGVAIEMVGWDEIALGCES